MDVKNQRCRVCDNAYQGIEEQCKMCGAPREITDDEAISAKYVFMDGGAPFINAASQMAA